VNRLWVFALCFDRRLQPRDFAVTSMVAVDCGDNDVKVTQFNG